MSPAADDAKWDDHSAMIWLLRHGDAEDTATDDASRRLTAKGERQAEAAGAALARLGAGIETCLTSPKLRAASTASLVCARLELKPEADESLRGGDFDPAALARGRGEVLLVGHEPDLSRAVQLATGARIEMKKGGLAVIEGGVLIALMRPGALRRIGGLD